MAGEATMFKFLQPRRRPQAVDVQAAAGWGIAAATFGLYLVQPWGWLRRTLFEKPEPEK